MIYTDSRYANGKAFRANDARTSNYSIAVLRRFPIQQSEFFNYVWVERDRMDIVAQEFLGSPNFWWMIMDFNPEILDPFDIPVGTLIRIPNVK
jgi:hypothetical protein